MAPTRTPYYGSDYGSLGYSIDPFTKSRALLGTVIQASYHTQTMQRAHASHNPYMPINYMPYAKYLDAREI